MLATHIVEAGGAVNDIEIKLGSRLFRKVDDDSNKKLLQDNGRVPLTGYFHIDYQNGNKLQNALLRGNREIRGRFNFTTAPSGGNYSIIHEIATEAVVTR